MLNFIFRTDSLDIGAVARAYGLLRYTISLPPSYLTPFLSCLVSDSAFFLFSLIPSIIHPFNPSLPPFCTSYLYCLLTSSLLPSLLLDSERHPYPQSITYKYLNIYLIGLHCHLYLSLNLLKSIPLYSILFKSIYLQSIPFTSIPFYLSFYHPFFLLYFHSPVFSFFRFLGYLRFPKR